MKNILRCLEFSVNVWFQEYNVNLGYSVTNYICVFFLILLQGNTLTDWWFPMGPWFKYKFVNT